MFKSRSTMKHKLLSDLNKPFFKKNNLMIYFSVHKQHKKHIACNQFAPNTKNQQQQQQKVCP